MAETGLAAASLARPTRASRLDRLLGSFPVLLTAAMLAQLIILSPVANTAYWEDDDPNSYTTGYIHWLGDTFWQWLGTANSTQFKDFGRVMPLGIFQTYGIFYVLHDRFVYKLILIGFTLSASAIFATVVWRLGAPAAVAALVAALPATMWQLHLLHDPLISYVGLVQAVTIYACGATLILLAWLRKGGRWRAALLILLTVCMLVTYESSYLLPLMLVPVAWWERRCTWRRAVVLAAPGTAVCVPFLLAALLLPRALPGYQANLDPLTVLTTWTRILTSGLPVAGWVAPFGPRGLPATATLSAVARGLGVAILLFPVLLGVARHRFQPHQGDRRSVVAILGVTGVLMLTPSALTSVAPQYQSQVVWGWGYLPMFFAVLGWAVLGALLITRLLRSFATGRPGQSLLVAILSIIGGATAAIDAEGSARVVAYMQPARESRDLLSTGFSRGALADVPSDASVLWFGPDILLPKSFWVPDAINLAAFTRQYVSRPMTMRVIFPTSPDASICTNAMAEAAPCATLRTPTFWIRTGVVNRRGFIAVAPVGVRHWNPTASTMEAETPPGATPLVYVQDPSIHGSPTGSPPFSISLLRAVSGHDLAEQITTRQLDVLRRGRGWVLVRLMPQRPFSASSLSVAFR